MAPIRDTCPDCGSEWEITDHGNGWFEANCSGCGKDRIGCPETLDGDQ
jgi:predicted  nucleic acid-binding Zn ribbon protein